MVCWSPARCWVCSLRWSWPRVLFSPSVDTAGAWVWCTEVGLACGTSWVPKRSSEGDGHAPTSPLRSVCPSQPQQRLVNPHNATHYQPPVLDTHRDNHTALVLTSWPGTRQELDGRLVAVAALL